MGSGHAVLGPSGSPRYEKCTGSVLFVQDLKEKGTIPQEQEEKIDSPTRIGTRAHQLLEHCLTPGKEIQPHLVEALMDEFGVWNPDAEMVNHIQNVIDYIGERQIALMPSECYSERKVDPEKYTKCPGQKGTLDIEILSLYKRELEVLDLKYGRGVKVQPESNSQLFLYAAGALAELSDAQLEKIEKVVLTIAQPRIPSPRGTVRSVTHTPAEIIARAEELGAAGQLALSGFAPKTPGEVQCRWCEGRDHCEERQQWALTESGAMFGDIKDMAPEAMEAQMIDAADSDPGALSDEQLAAVLNGIPGLEAYIKDMKAEAQRRLEIGRKLPGFKLVSGKRSRAWKVEEKDLKQFLKTAKIKVSAYSNTTILGVAAVRALLPEHRRDKFDQLWSWQSGRPAVAQETDERPALDMSAVTFSPVKAD